MRSSAVKTFLANSTMYGCSNMNDILEFIEDIEELKALYNTGELRNFDFEAMLSKYNRTVDLFEREYEMDDGA